MITGGRKLLAKLSPASKGYASVMKMMPQLTKVATKAQETGDVVRTLAHAVRTQKRLDHGAAYDHDLVKQNRQEAGKYSKAELDDRRRQRSLAYKEHQLEGQRKSREAHEARQAHRHERWGRTQERLDIAERVEREVTVRKREIAKLSHSWQRRKEMVAPRLRSTGAPQMAAAGETVGSDSSLPAAASSSPELLPG